MIAYNLNDAVGKYRDIKKLYLRNVGLKELPEAILEMENLRFLGLSKNRISDLPDWIKTLTSLEGLDFSENEFEEIPEVVFFLPNIKSVNFAQNKLKEIPSTISRVKFLEEFIASKNQISEIPKALFSKSLKQLDLSDNRISKIPKTLLKAINLERLLFSNNKISQFPLIDYSQLSISQIYINRNNLKSLPEDIGALKNLRNLNVQGNKIKGIPNSIGECQHLWDLDVSQNKIESLPSSIGQCQWLHELSFQKNKIREIPSSIGNLKRLRKLDLEYNKLEMLPESFIKLTNLNFLLLNGNNIEYSTSGLIHLGRLKKITGLTNLFTIGEKKKFLTFLKYCKRDKIEITQRQSIFKLYQNKGRLSKNDLIVASNFSVQRIRQNAQSQIFNFFNLKKPITSNSIIHFTGQDYRSKKKFIIELNQLNIKYQLKFDNKVTHIVLGDFPNKLTLQKAKKITFISEQELLKFTQSNLEHVDFSPEKIENLSRLLLSEQKENLLLGIQILENTYVPDYFITELFIAHKICSISSVRKSLRSLLMLYASSALRDKLNTQIRIPNKIITERHQERLAAFVEGTELDLNRLVEFFTDRK